MRSFIRLALRPSVIPAWLAVLAIAGLTWVAGCDSGSTGPNKTSDSKSAASGGDSRHHGEEDRAAPHGGHIIELGRNHQYHAELVEDEKARTVTIYILDKEMKELPIDQPSIAVNLVVDGKAQSFTLAAAGAQDGKASRFVSSGEALFEALHEHDASGKLRVTINGSPYSGEIAHDHDHEGKGHKHEHKHEH